MPIQVWGGSLFYRRARCWVKVATVKCAGLGAMTVLGATVFVSPSWSQDAVAEGWKIAAPWRSAARTGTPAFMAKELTKVLQVPVEVETSVEGTLDGALIWSLANAKTQPSLVLLSDELVQTGGVEDPNNPRNLSLYEPLALMLLTRWCLFVPAGGQPVEPKTLLESLRVKRASPHIAIPELGGRMSVWVRGMEQRTHRKWQVSTYGLRGSVAEALRRGADVALGYCSRQKAHPEQTRILLQSGNIRSDAMPDVPLSAASGWMPMDHGWVAWAVPKAVAPVQREKMAVALYRVMGTASMKERLGSVGHVFEHWTPQQSREHIEAFTRTWQSISHLLDQGESQDVKQQHQMP